MRADKDGTWERSAAFMSLKEPSSPAHLPSLTLKNASSRPQVAYLSLKDARIQAIVGSISLRSPT